jgi:hypothetical protein
MAYYKRIDRSYQISNCYLNTMSWWSYRGQFYSSLYFEIFETILPSRYPLTLGMRTGPARLLLRHLNSFRYKKSKLCLIPDESIPGIEVRNRISRFHHGSVLIDGCQKRKVKKMPRSLSALGTFQRISPTYSVSSQIKYVLASSRLGLVANASISPCSQLIRYRAHPCFDASVIIQLIRKTFTTASIVPFDFIPHAYYFYSPDL